MTRVAIVSVAGGEGRTVFRATAGDKRSEGRTAGEALDALAAQLPEDEAGTLIVVQSGRPDRLFGAEEQQRLGVLMQRWREARDRGASLPTDEADELERLVEEELRASAERAESLADELAR